MVLDFVLYAFDPEKEVSVPLLIVAIPSAVYEFFEKNKFADKTQGQALIEWVIDKIDKLAMQRITLPYGWEFFLNTLSVAIYRKDNIHVLPRVFLQ
jgi:hypothetical protein